MRRLSIGSHIIGGKAIGSDGDPVGSLTFGHVVGSRAAKECGLWRRVCSVGRSTVQCVWCLAYLVPGSSQSITHVSDTE